MNFSSAMIVQETAHQRKGRRDNDDMRNSRTFGICILWTLILIGSSMGSAQETPGYTYDLTGSPASFLILSPSYSLDFSDDSFEKALMVTGWHDGENGRWTGKEATAEMFLPIVGPGTQEMELVCYSLASKDGAPQILTIHEGDQEIWTGPVRSDQASRIRLKFDNGDRPLVLHRLTFGFSRRDKSPNEKDIRQLAVNFKFVNVNHRGSPKETRSPHIKARPAGLALQSDEVLLMPLAAPQTVECDLRFTTTEGSVSGTVWLLTKQGETKALTFREELPVSLPENPKGVDWIAVRFDKNCTLEAAVLSRLPGVVAQPNVLLLSLDTVRADDLPFYGNKILDCPNISLLAEEGVVFENGFSQCDGTNPSFASIMSSRYVHEHQVLNLITPLPDKFETIAEVLQKDGYSTAAFISVVFLTAENSGLNQGFNVYSSVTDWQRRDREAKETTEAFLTWLAAGASEPYFVWLHFYDAHTPYRPPESIAKKYYPGNPVKPDAPALMESLPGSDRHSLSWLGPVSDPDYPYLMHLGEIEDMDQQIGRVWSSMKGAGAWDNSIVMLTADHGESFGEKKVYFAHHGMHDANLHVPFVWKTPSGRFAGKRHDQLVESVDIGPTLYSLLGIEQVPETSGCSLARLVWPEAAKGVQYHERAEVFSEQVAQPPMAAGMVRTNRLKLVVPNPKIQDDFLNYEEALYDVKKDPAEETNIIQDATQEATRLRAIYDRWHEGVENIGPNKQEELEQEKWKALKDLGYTN